MTKEILDWNVCQVTVTESIVVFLQSRSSIYIFTDLLFFLLCLFAFISFCVHCAISQYFTWGSLTQMASCNQEFHSWLMADGFAFSFGQQKSVGRSLTFKVSAYRWRNTVLLVYFFFSVYFFLHWSFWVHLSPLPFLPLVLRAISYLVKLNNLFLTLTFHQFNPLTPKISLVILLNVCQMILMVLVWRIWYQIN